MAEARRGTSGIFKQPVNSARITRNGLSNDTIVDTEVHGGLDQAVYLYARDDYNYWSETLGRELAAGLFGENLTISTMGVGPVRAGARYRIGDVELEVTLPRIPCRTFQAVMDEPGWVSRFSEARRPGYYCRVVSEGDVAPGHEVERLAAAETHITIDELLDLLHDRTPDRQRLRVALDSPIGERGREHLQRRFDKFVET